MLQLACLAMRTRFEIVLADTRDEASLRAAGEEALAEILQTETLLNPYANDSEIFKLNAHAADWPVKVDPRVYTLILIAMKLYRETGGAFDMASGALASCWNLAAMSAGPDGQGGAAPTREEIELALQCSGMARCVSADPHQQKIRFSKKGVRLDPGGIGKGWALDRALLVLKESGIESALLHGGTSSVYGLGAPLDQPGWKVGIRKPAGSEESLLLASPGADDELLATVNLLDEALSVSAPHGKSIVIQGKRYGHVLDPRKGWPVDGPQLAAAVYPTGTTAEVLSTALLVVGEEGADELLTKFPGANFLLVTRAGEVRTWGSAFER
jgi:thiamine biosynthesis lipoprotein